MLVVVRGATAGAEHGQPALLRVTLAGEAIT